MKKLFPLLGAFAACSLVPAFAQVEPANAAGVAFGHFHTVVRDVNASRKFWVVLGGTALKIDGTDVVKFPGALVFITKGSPTAGSFGSVVNHVKFIVPDVDAAVARWKAGGDTAEAVHSEYAGNAIGWAYTPDNLKIRFNPDKTLPGPIGRPGIQYWTTGVAVPEVQAWYVKTFGGKIGPAANNGGGVGGIPGFQLTVTNSGEQPPARTPRGVGMINGKLADQAFMDQLAKTNLLAPTKGRTLDHIGFEITGLAAFCKQLESSGIKFDEPYSKTRHKSFASAMFTDPWGVTIELTDGLRRF